MQHDSGIKNYVCKISNDMRKAYDIMLKETEYYNLYSVLTSISLWRTYKIKLKVSDSG